jgi:hypothetical protein
MSEIYLILLGFLIEIVLVGTVGLWLWRRGKRRAGEMTGDLRLPDDTRQDVRTYLQAELDKTEQRLATGQSAAPAAGAQALRAELVALTAANVLDVCWQTLEAGYCDPEGVR